MDTKELTLHPVLPMTRIRILVLATAAQVRRKRRVMVMVRRGLRRGGLGLTGVPAVERVPKRIVKMMDRLQVIQLQLQGILVHSPLGMLRGL